MEPPIDFLLITPLADERDAVIRKINNLVKLPPIQQDTRTYYGADFQTMPSGGSGSTYRIVLLPLLNMGRVEAATATTDALHLWQPRYVLLIGIAGGFAKSGVSLGDVLVADKLVDYELQKLLPSAPHVRWSVHNADARLFSSAKNLTAVEWVPLVEQARPSDGRPSVHFGPVFSGDKIDASGTTMKFLDVWPKAIGVEMEAGGIGTAAFEAAKVPGVLMIRGVSDLADPNKETAQQAGWRAYACDAAASFACGLLRSEPVPIQQSSQGESHIGKASETAEHLRETVAAALKRLRFLELRKASMGWDASTSLLMEIDELKKEIEAMKKQA